MHTLGVVSYFNALPLWKPLESLAAPVSIVRDVPANLGAKLQSGEVDVALLPIVDWFRLGGHLISNAGIAADGPVRSVLIFARRPPHEWRTLGLDTSSHTSVALTQILVREHWKCAPQLESHAPDFETMQANLDAWLLIGDPALRARHRYLHDPAIHIFDLAEEWCAMTGLPFVFAAWIARHDMELCEREDLGDLLSLARDRGLRQIPQLAREAEAGDLAPEEIEDYLQNAIRYTFSERHRAAIELFRTKCAAHGLI